MSLLRPLRPILKDFLSTIVFVSALWISNDILLATAVGIAVGVLQAAWMLVRRRPIAPLQWMSLCLVAVLGTTTIITHNGLFFKLKSSIIALVLAAVMMRRQWFAPYLPPFIAQHLDDESIRGAARGWAALFVAIALANAAVAYFCTDRVWAAFIFCVPALSYIVLIGVQYRMFRDQIRAAMTARRDNGR